MMQTTVVPIPCQACGEPLARVEEMRENGVVFDLYRCSAEDCGRKAVVIYEPVGGYTDDNQTFIQREIARRGAFFPSDYIGNRGLRR